MRMFAEAELPANGSHANAPTTECLWHEGPQRPVDVGPGRTGTEWRRGGGAKHRLHGTLFLSEVRLWQYLQEQVLRL